MMNPDEWQHPDLFPYWDQRVSAIATFRERLLSLPAEDRGAALAIVRETVRASAQACSDEDLQKLIVTAGDDLYKAANAIDEWDEVLRLYLDSSAGEFFDVVRARGYRLHYIVDNTFPDLSRPLNFDAWFTPCRILYICPQLLATKMMELDKVDASNFQQNLPKYIDEGRHLAEKSVWRCGHEGLHFLFLDADSQEGSFTVAQAASNQAGVITVLRNEAPVPGSKIDVHFAGAPGHQGKAKKPKKESS